MGKTFMAGVIVKKAQKIHKKLKKFRRGLKGSGKKMVKPAFFFWKFKNC
jgi:hypothetical protein